LYLESMIALSPATKADRIALDNLMQFYVYDWSEIRPLDVAGDGRFEPYPTEAYWDDEWHHPLLLRVGGNLAGFALIAGRSRLTGAPNVFDMAEFFVMRRYRGSGIGLAAAAAAFDRFRGPWEIRQRDENTGATAFWRKAVDRYTRGRYREVRWDDPAWVGPVQMFSSAERDR
jgi:predicted acetyltransferase